MVDISIDLLKITTSRKRTVVGRKATVMNTYQFPLLHFKQLKLIECTTGLLTLPT